MRQKSSPDFITLQCLPEDTKEFQTNHTCLTTMTVNCFLNTFSVLPLFFPSSSIILSNLPHSREAYSYWLDRFTGTAHHGCFSISQYKFPFAPALLCLSFPKPSLLPDLTFLNYATLILRKQNVGRYSHEFLYTLSLGTGLIQLNSS